MLRDIIRKEIVETITSPKFIFTFLLCTVLILLSVYTGIGNFVSNIKEYEAAVALDKEDLENVTSYSQVTYSGIKINRSPCVLSIISNGVDEAVGRVATVAYSGDIKLIESENESNPMFSVFGSLDLTYIFKIVLSLFAILLTYNAICGEKELGTLKLTLANKVPRDRYILGKAIGGYISLLIPLIIPLILSLLIILAYPGIHLTGGDWGRLLLMFLFFFLYLSVFFTLGLYISTQTKKSSTSLLILLFIWVVFVTVIPKAAVMTAARIKSIPSLHEMTYKKESYSRQTIKTYLKEIQDWYNINESKANEDPKGFIEKQNEFLKELDKKYTSLIEAHNAALERDYQLKRRAQQNLAINLSRISPASALTFSTMSLARTGLDEHQRFLDSIRNYQSIFSEWGIEKVYQNRDLINNEKPKEKTKIDLTTMPVYTYTKESLGKSLTRTIPDLVLMIVMIIVFFVGAYVSFLKYDVR